MIALAAIANATLFWFELRPNEPGHAFASGNGRIEATEVDIASKLGRR